MNPIMHMKVAVAAGDRIKQGLTRFFRSATAPISGLNRDGSCMNTVSDPACVSVRPKFLMINGSTGARKLVYMS